MQQSTWPARYAEAATLANPLTRERVGPIIHIPEYRNQSIVQDGVSIFKYLRYALSKTLHLQVNVNFTSAFFGRPVWFFSDETRCS